MNTQNILEIADNIVYKKTGKHLTDLQFDLLQAACDNKTYEEFALSRGYCLDYIKKDIGAELWHLLSNSLGEKVTKKNFRHAFERYQRLPVTNGEDQLQSMNCINGVDTPDLSTFQQSQHGQSPTIVLIQCGEKGQNLISNLIAQIQADLPSEDRCYSIMDHFVSFNQGRESEKYVDKYTHHFPNQQEVRQQVSYLLHQCLNDCACLIILDNLDNLNNLNNLLTAMGIWKNHQLNS